MSLNRKFSQQQNSFPRLHVTEDEILEMIERNREGRVKRALVDMFSNADRSSQ